MKSLIVLGLVLVTATLATAQVAHADLSNCVPLIAKQLNDTGPINDNVVSAKQDMAKVWQCIQANQAKK
jgi:hypothetical protein